jgi:hypothetical protein
MGLFSSLLGNAMQRVRPDQLLAGGMPPDVFASHPAGGGMLESLGSALQKGGGDQLLSGSRMLSSFSQQPDFQQQLGGLMAGQGPGAQTPIRNAPPQGGQMQLGQMPVTPMGQDDELRRRMSMGSMIPRMGL